MHATARGLGERPVAPALRPRPGRRVGWATRWAFPLPAAQGGSRGDDHALARITSLHTLGPSGTNCELAARRWFARAGRRGDVVLHPSVDEAADRVLEVPGAALLACCADPELNTLVYSRLGRLVMVDCLLVPTHHMVLARRPGVVAPESILLHPAPAALVPATFRRRILAAGNSEAARRCAGAEADACLTTLPAALREGLEVERDFGPVPLSFSVHVPVHPACAPPRSTRRSSLAS